MQARSQRVKVLAACSLSATTARVLAVIIATDAGSVGAVIVNIALAAIFAPLLVRFICCAYENP